MHMLKLGNLELAFTKKFIVGWVRVSIIYKETYIQG